MNNKYNRNPIMQSNDNLIHLNEKNTLQNNNDSNNFENILIRNQEYHSDKMCIDTGKF